MFYKKECRKQTYQRPRIKTYIAIMLRSGYIFTQISQLIAFLNMFAYGVSLPPPKLYTPKTQKGLYIDGRLR